MNALEELIRTSLVEDAQRAPSPESVLARVSAYDVPKRRTVRRRWLAVAAATATVATIVAGGATQIGGDGDSEVSGATGFEQRRVTYAEGSTIHYGDQAIDVAPHEPIALVQTDDGFVFATATSAWGRYDVYFTKGDGVERIGQAVGGGEFDSDGIGMLDDPLVSDDTGSYVGWVDQDDAVVYDTARRTEALRTPIAYPAEDEYGWRSVAAIDGGSAYVVNPDSVEVWDLSTESKTNTITRPDFDLYDTVSDVANGYFLWQRSAVPAGGVVSRDPYAKRPFSRAIWHGFLSPDGGYVATGEYQILDGETLEDVTPEGFGEDYAVVQWLDDDRYVADTSDPPSFRANGKPHDLLVCSVAAGDCRPVVESVGKIIYPDGAVPEWALPERDDEDGATE